MAELPTKKEIAKLPKWAIVAFAARCAQRVLPLFRLPHDHRDLVKHLRSVRSAVNSVQQSAATTSHYFYINAVNVANAVMEATKANPVSSIATKAANATLSAARAVDAAWAAPGLATAASATYAIKVATEEAAAHAVNGATEAANAVAKANAVFDVRSADNQSIADLIRSDFEALRSYADHYRWDDDSPVSQDFFGPMWPDGEPDWYGEGLEWQQRVLAEAETREDEADETEESTTENEDQTPIAGPLRVYIDSDAYSAHEKGELLSLISELYELQTGDQLEIDNLGTAVAASLVPNGGAP